MATVRDRLRPPAASYEGDFYSWALDQAALLRAGRFTELDLENLAEEVEDLANRHADQLESRYAVLLTHLLKWEFQPGRRSWTWLGTIRRERHRIDRLLNKNPGLKPRRADLFEASYLDARANAGIETGLPPEHFPAACPYSLE